MALHNIKIVVVDGGRSGTYKSKNAGIEGDPQSPQKNKRFCHAFVNVAQKHGSFLSLPKPLNVEKYIE